MACGAWFQLAGRAGTLIGTQGQGEGITNLANKGEGCRLHDLNYYRCGVRQPFEGMPS